ncbi:acyltransferase family protein [Lactiplantibacillus pentosus]|uniref:acyltransferase family protein n=1 Tax=Lactiplantibacillus pentosus TaxID=1589 RepID=UPI0037044A2E
MLQHLSGSVHTLYSWGSLLYIFKQPIGYLWFLYILFFVFVLVGFLDLLKINMYLQGLVYLLLFIGSQYVSLPYVLSRTFTWTICFYLGFMIKQVHLEKKIQNVFFVIAAIVFLMGAIQQYFSGGDWYHTNLLLIGNFLTKISSIPIAFYFFSRLPKTSVFDYFVKYGKYSLIIYLIHAPVTSIVRVILLRVGLSNYFVLMVGITVITWYVSVFVCWLSQKISLIDMVFSPYKYIAHRKVPA